MFDTSLVYFVPVSTGAEGSACQRELLFFSSVKSLVGLLVLFVCLFWNKDKNWNIVCMLT